MSIGSFWMGDGGMGGSAEPPWRLLEEVCFGFRRTGDPSSWSRSRRFSDFGERRRLATKHPSDDLLDKVGDDGTSGALSGGEGNGLGSSDIEKAHPTPGAGGKMGVEG